MNRQLPLLSVMCRLIIGALRHESLHSFIFVIAVGLSVLSPNKSIAQGVAPWVHQSFNGERCTGGEQGYGPFDYLNRANLAENLEIVERFHFTSEIENLVAKKPRSTQIGDIAYTLRAWPNHHRALYAMIKAQKTMSEVEAREFYAKGIPPVECYLYRAINYSPSDATPHMFLGMLHHSNRAYELAVASYEQSLKLDPESIQSQYNFALLLFDMKEYERARFYAKRVYSAEFPLFGLRRKLERIGEWR